MNNPEGCPSTIIGVISDTHGHMAPEIPRIFEDVDIILHAGDIDSPEILKLLEAIAPVIAVRGNMDRGDWTQNLCKTELVEIRNVGLYVVHDLYNLDIDPEAIGVRVVVYGHTHQAKIHENRQVMFINPGSATLPRNGTSPSVAVISICNKRLVPRIIHLNG